MPQHLASFDCKTQRRPHCKQSDQKNPSVLPLSCLGLASLAGGRLLPSKPKDSCSGQIATTANGFRQLSANGLARGKAAGWGRDHSDSKVELPVISGTLGLEENVNKLLLFSPPFQKMTVYVLPEPFLFIYLVGGTRTGSISGRGRAVEEAAELRIHAAKHSRAAAAAAGDLVALTAASPQPPPYSDSPRVPSCRATDLDTFICVHF